MRLQGWVWCMLQAWDSPGRPTGQYCMRPASISEVLTLPLNAVLAARCSLVHGIQSRKKGIIASCLPGCLGPARHRGHVDGNGAGVLGAAVEPMPKKRCAGHSVQASISLVPWHVMVSLRRMRMPRASERASCCRRDRRGGLESWGATLDDGWGSGGPISAPAPAQVHVTPLDLVFNNSAEHQQRCLALHHSFEAGALTRYLAFYGLLNIVKHSRAVGWQSAELFLKVEYVSVMFHSSRIPLLTRSFFSNTIPTKTPTATYRQLHASAINMTVQRITMFKVANEADIPQFLERYQTLAREQNKDGKPYILSVDAHQPVNDPRSQSYNVLAHTTFSSLDDVKYYDEECEAHKGLKAFAKEKVAGPPMVVMWEA
ncbi:hypothetical protein Q7P37_007938 [Cladosporium fusiforme]